MKIGITKLIPENIAPTNASNLAIYNGTTKICNVDMTNMTPVNLGTKLYSFGVLSDIHMYNTTSKTRFSNAISFFENQSCSFCCIAGDLTGYGFWNPVVEGEYGNSIYDTTQFDIYKEVIENHIPIYECSGNHESYNGCDISSTSKVDNKTGGTGNTINTLEKWIEYTGNALTYTKTQGNDVFIFVGQSTQALPMTYEHFTWLGNTLEANKNKRCFVFIHPYVDVTDCGNPLGLHKTPLFNNLNKNTHGFTKSEFINLLKNYPNAILFHGHSHMKFENQYTVKNTNYSNNLGFKSVHIPSISYCRNISTGTMVNESNTAQGYICDVYSNHIVLKGYDFLNNCYIPIAQYCIKTN